jgi:hypothetical protein
MYLVIGLLIAIGVWSVFVAGYAFAAPNERNKKVTVVSLRLIFGLFAVCLAAYLLATKSG